MRDKDRPHFYNMAGQPIEAETAYRLLGGEFDIDRVVCRNEQGDVSVSTVLLVIDHAFEGEPLIFETMVFGGEHDELCERYSTRDEAVKGHQRVCETVFQSSKDR
jgi:hypothetical protein